VGAVSAPVLLAEEDTDAGAALAVALLAEEADTGFTADTIEYSSVALRQMPTLAGSVHGVVVQIRACERKTERNTRKIPEHEMMKNAKAQTTTCHDMQCD
jgi:hypothetical protein